MARRAKLLVSYGFASTSAIALTSFFPTFQLSPSIPISLIKARSLHTSKPHSAISSLKNVFQTAPVFVADPKKIQFLETPTQFYETLKVLFLTFIIYLLLLQYLQFLIVNSFELGWNNFFKKKSHYGSFISRKWNFRKRTCKMSTILIYLLIWVYLLLGKKKKERKTNAKEQTLSILIILKSIFLFFFKKKG